MEESEILWRQYLWLLEELNIWTMEEKMDDEDLQIWGLRNWLDGGTIGGVVIWWERLDL